MPLWLASSASISKECREEKKFSYATPFVEAAVSFKLRRIVDLLIFMILISYCKWIKTAVKYIEGWTVCPQFTALSPLSLCDHVRFS